MEDSANDTDKQSGISTKSSFQSQDSKQGDNEKQLLDWKVKLIIDRYHIICQYNFSRLFIIDLKMNKIEIFV